GRASTREARSSSTTSGLLLRTVAAYYARLHGTCTGRGPRAALSLRAPAHPRREAARTARRPTGREAPDHGYRRWSGPPDRATPGRVLPHLRRRSPALGGLSAERPHARGRSPQAEVRGR